MNLIRTARSGNEPFRVQFTNATLSLMNGLPKERRDEVTAYIDENITKDPYAEGEPNFERDRRILAVGSVTLTCMVTEATRMVTVVNLEENPE